MIQPPQALSLPPPSTNLRGTQPVSESRLSIVLELMREMSVQTDPQAMVSLFRKRAFALYGGHSSVSLSRRDLDPPYYRITRSTKWTEDINPWLEPHRLPILQGGLLGELLYADRPQVLEDVRVDSSDPAHEHLHEARSLVSLPIFDGGLAVNMVVRMSREPAAWDENRLADAVLEANLFGRATTHLLLAQRLHKAYAELDHEMKRVAEIQRALLPSQLPRIPSMDLAVSYQTAARAGGDYYDFFDLGEGRWGVLMADVSGHGTPAAVVMAMFRSMLHGECHACSTPAEVLARSNSRLQELTDRYSPSFVTAFYGMYDSRDRTLRYSCAGHPPPLLVDAGAGVRELDEAQSLPLAVEATAEFREHRVTLTDGDTLLLYTDGITEAVNASGESYGRERLLSCVHENVPNAQHIIDCVTLKLLGFTAGSPQQDDQTLLAMRIRG